MMQHLFKELDRLSDDEDLAGPISKGILLRLFRQSSCCANSLVAIARGRAKL
jgi:hypothetical protein